MSTKKNTQNKNNNRRKVSADNVPKIDSKTLDKLSQMYIYPIQKQSAKFPKSRFHCRICLFRLESVESAMRHSIENTHKNNVHRICTQNLLKYLPIPTLNQFEVIESCLKDVLELEIFISKTESDRRKSVCAEMNAITGEIGGKLHICGSLATGLSMINVSDVNLYFEIVSPSSTSYFKQLELLSTRITDKLQFKTEIKQEKDNYGLFVRDSTKLCYHISASTRVCCLTSHYISIQLSIDERAKTLVQLLRYFANQAFIDRDRDGLWPSQVFTLVTIFYLQQLSSPLLPNLHRLAELHPELPASSITAASSPYDDTSANIRYVSDINTIRSIWQPPTNNSSIAQLWIGLLRFLTVEFDSSYMISVRCQEPVLKIDRNIVNKRLAVEDPFDYKRNLLFGWNSPDVIDFLNDQLQSCYMYFAVPQLASGPAFTKVNFTERTLKSMETNCLITPTFTKDDFTDTIEFLETEFKKLYDQEFAAYDVSRCPVTLFVKSCLAKILTIIFDSKSEIDLFVSFSEFKSASYFHVPNCSSFKDRAVKLAMRVLQSFSDYFEITSSWNKQQMSSKEAFKIIKTSAQRFVSESLNITMNDDDYDEEEFDIPDMDENEVDIEGAMDEHGITLEDDNDEHDPKPNNCTSKPKESVADIVKKTDRESWKIPISYKLIYIPINGELESGNEPDVYNEHRVQSIKKEELIYSFSKMNIQRKKLDITCGLCNNKGHRKESCRYAIPQFEDLKNVMRDVKNEWLNKLKVVLAKKYEFTRPPKDRVIFCQNVFTDINEIIKNIYPNARPQLFGSTHNGFMTRVSDIDICLEFYTEGKRQDLSNEEITIRLKRIGKELKRTIKQLDVGYILRAKVPIVKFFIGNFIQGDISINNSLGIQNTKMIKVYSDICPEMKDLGNLLKFVSKSCDIGDASQGTLSSYAYIVMLIHFLQKRELLPVLQEVYDGSEKPSVVVDGWNAWFQSNLALVSKHWKPKTTGVSLAYLWIDFFYYYTVEFNTDREVISIKQKEPLYKIDKGWMAAYLAIEDPFDLDRNLARCLSLDNCRYILYCFAHVLRLHSHSEHMSRSDIPFFMEPLMLIPPIESTKFCYQCHQPGHVSQRCKEVQNNKTAVKNVVPIKKQENLPNLPSSFTYRESTTANRLYLEANVSDNPPQVSVPLGDINSSTNDFSIVPITVNVGSKTIVIPMLVDRVGRIFDVLNNVFKNGVQNLCSLPVDVDSVNIRAVEVPRKVVTDAVVTASNSATNDNNNAKMPLPKKLPSAVQNNCVPNDVFNQPVMQQMTMNGYQNFNPLNQSRFMAPQPNYQNAAGNMGGRYQNYNTPQGYHYRPLQGQPQRFPQSGYHYEQQNSRHGTPNQGNMRYAWGNK